MGVRILYDDGRRSDYSGSNAALYCSTTGVAFGPVFSEDHQRDADERAEAFLRWLQIDPRKLTDAELSAKYSEWLAQEVAQYAAEAKAEEDAAAELDRQLLLAFPVKGTSPMTATRKAYHVLDGDPPKLEELTIIVTPKRVAVQGTAFGSAIQSYYEPPRFWRKFAETPTEAWTQFLNLWRQERDALQAQEQYATAQITAAERHLT